MYPCSFSQKFVMVRDRVGRFGGSQRCGYRQTAGMECRYPPARSHSHLSESLVVVPLIVEGLSCVE